MKATAVSGDLLVKIGIGAGLIVIAYVLLKRTGGVAAQVAEKVGAAVNPANPDNIVNQGVSAAGAAVTGNKNWTLGTWLYDVFNGDELAAADKAQADKKRREAEAELLRESRRGQLDTDVLSVPDWSNFQLYP